MTFTSRCVQPLRRACLGLLLLGWLGGVAHAEITDIHSAINQAGLERATAQRLAKLYLQLHLEVDTPHTQQSLTAATAQFERQLTDLTAYAPTPAIRALYQELARAWAQYRSVLSQPPTPERSKEVLALSELTLKIAQQGVDALEKHSASHSGHLVNLAGRQRMLSQRMAKLYHAQTLGIADSNSAAQIAQDRQEFTNALTTLDQVPNASEKITAGLRLIGPQWMFFNNALDKPAHNDPKASTTVATTSERIFEQLDTLTGEFAKLGAQASP